MKNKLVFLPALILLSPLAVGMCAAKLSVLGGLTVQKVVAPGESYEGTLWIKNDSESLVEAKIYQTDYMFFADGSNRYDKPGTVKRSNAKWVSLDHPYLSIPPKETSGVRYTVRVPKEKSLVGTYWSMVMVEEAEILSKPAQKKENQIRIGIRHVVRYGIQMVTHIADTGIRKIKILQKKLLVDGSKKTYQIDIENTGERWQRPQVWVELFNEKAVSVGRFEGVKMRIFPGTSIRQSIDLSGVPPGQYEVLIVIDNGDENVFGSRTKLKL